MRLKALTCDEHRCEGVATDQLFADGKPVGVYCPPHGAERKKDIDVFEESEQLKVLA